MNRGDSRKEECQQLKQCIKTKWFNRSNLISLTGSDLTLGSLSRQMKKLHWFLSVSMFWKGALRCRTADLAAASWRIVFVHIQQSGFHRRRSIKSGEHMYGGISVTWHHFNCGFYCLLHLQALSWIINAASSCGCCGNNMSTDKNFFLSLATEALHL